MFGRARRTKQQPNRKAAVSPAPKRTTPSPNNKKKAKPKKKVAPAKGILVDGSNKKQSFWEVEAIVSRRLASGSKKKMEYEVQWKGCKHPEENTWEPADNLCDTALEEAEALEHDEDMPTTPASN